MAETVNPFATPAMAEGYARNRPALHARIVECVCAALGVERIGRVAVDIGCGSGLSTKPLVGRADCVVGIEPVFEMTASARAVAPGAEFVNGRGEAMPFGGGEVDFMTAAGSLNFAKPGEVLREARRALRREGALCVYDFAQGRTFAGAGELAGWFAEFLVRYPRPTSEAIPLDTDKIAAMAKGFRVAGAEKFQIELDYDWRAYAGYMMTETNVASALRRGVEEQAIRGWLEATLPGVFGTARRQVAFPGYWIALRPD